MRKYFEFAQILLILIASNLLIANGTDFVGNVLMSSPKGNQPKIASSDSKNACEKCESVVSGLQMALSIDMSTARILEEASQYCTVMNLQTPAVCNGSVYSSLPEVIEIIKTVNMSTAEVCYFIFVDACEEKAKHPSHLWNISMPSIQKPTLEAIPMPKDDAPRLKVLHLTDTHYDPFYLVGSNADCPEPMCCRNHDGLGSLSYNAAGKWGAFKCDLPKRTFEHVLDFIAQTHTDIDYVIWTGDLVPHDLWSQTNDQLMQAIEESIDLVTEKLPGVRVFPAIGNHERVPVNSFPVIEQDGSIEAFYNDINEFWSRWLPLNTSDTIRRGAFYSTLVRPGLRIISLNTNVCYKYNFWLLQNSTDPMSQLQWLLNELQMAEAAYEKVHIIGHIPPGSADCLKVWSHNYYEIVARYENTITGQFFGHTHHDEIEIFYDPENFDRVTNVAYISPSLTPFEYGNPAFRIYHVDGDHNETTRLVVDYETWIMNLEEANLSDNPVWRKSYSARDAYSMQSLRPTDWNDFIAKMANDDELFNAYHRNYWRDSPLRPECLPDCRQTILCQAKSGRSHDKENLCPEYVDNNVIQY